MADHSYGLGPWVAQYVLRMEAPHCSSYSDRVENGANYLTSSFRTFDEQMFGCDNRCCERVAPAGIIVAIGGEALCRCITTVSPATW